MRIGLTNILGPLLLAVLILISSVKTYAQQAIPKEIEKLLFQVIELENKKYTRLAYTNTKDQKLISASNKLFESYKGRTLKDSDLIKFLKQLNQLNKALGTSEGGVEYVTKYANQGILALKLNHFIINAVKLDNKSSVWNGMAKMQMGNAKTMIGKQIDTDRLEYTKDKLKEFYGISADYELVNDAEDPNKRAVIYSVKNDREPEFYLQVDNHLSVTSGDANFRAGAEFQNLLGFGGKYEVDINATNQDSQTVALSYEMPTPYWGIRSYADYVYNRSKRDLTFTAGEEEGEFISFNSGIRKDFIKTDEFELTGAIGTNGYRDNSETSTGLSITDKRDKIFVEADASYFTDKTPVGKYFYGFANLRYEKGIELLSKFDASNSSLTNAEADPDIISYYLFAQNAITDKLNLGVSSFGQYSPNLLLSSDLFSIGGKSTVRGFDRILASGESGYTASLEVDYDYFKNDKYKLNAGIFYDYGAVSTNDNSQISLADDSASSWGIKSSNKLKFIGDNATKLELNLGFPIGTYQDPDVPSSHLNFKIKQEF